MPAELHYTSLPRGLAPGSQGFATVAKTTDLPPPLQARLEALSGYREIPGLPPNEQPVNWSFLRLAVGGASYAILSRVAFAGADYTGRTNKYAHHLVLSAEECARIPAGPAWLLMQPGVMDTVWRGEARMLPAGRSLPTGFATPDAPAPCAAWQQTTGDAGWGGALAREWMERSGHPVRLVYGRAQAPVVLSLLAEAMTLLAPARRWDVTFSTYAANLPRDAACGTRGVPAIGADAADTPPQAGERVFDLTRPMGRAPNDEWSAAARAGHFVTAASPAGRRITPSTTPAPVLDLTPPPTPAAAVPRRDVQTGDYAPVRPLGYGRVSPPPTPAGTSPWPWIVLCALLALLAAVGWGLWWQERAKPSVLVDTAPTEKVNNEFHQDTHDAPSNDGSAPVPSNHIAPAPEPSKSKEASDTGIIEMSPTAHDRDDVEKSDGERPESHESGKE